MAIVTITDGIFMPAPVYSAVRRHDVLHASVHYLSDRPTNLANAICKGDEASQWRKPKFDPPPRHAQTPQAIVIQIGTGDYVVDPYTCAKVRYVSLPRMRDFAHQNVSFWVFLGSCNSLQARALGGF